MRQLPQFTYCGLTIVLSNPSRFDIQANQLLSGISGLNFKENCLRPEINYLQCDIRTTEETGQLLPGTKALLLLGEKAFQDWTQGRYKSYSLNQQRGCPLESRFKIPTIASYLPIDAYDIQDYEISKNPILAQTSTISEGGYIKDEEEEEEDTKDHGKTARSHFSFWLWKDCKRIISTLVNGNIPSIEESRFDIYPSIKEISRQLFTIKNQTLYLDIECEPITFNLWCIGLSFGLPNIYCVPIFRFDGSFAYSNLYSFFASLAIALRDNQVVIHNSQFDLFVLTHRYHIPFGKKIYDTMLAHHRVFVGIEKSLGHCMSHLTWLPYHKDQGIYAPQNPLQERKLWEYNCRDIQGMILVKQELDKLCEKDAGLKASVDQSNECIYPYLLNTLVGIKIDKQEAEKLVRENDRKMMQILRIIKILTGGIEVLPSSNKQMVEYFHNIMNYPIVKRSERTRQPGLGEKEIYQLRLKMKDQKIVNPILDLAIQYRRIQKETGTIGPKWHLWKD